MGFANKDNLLHLSMPWELANELENQVFGSNSSSGFGGNPSQPLPSVFNSGFKDSGNIFVLAGNPFSQNAADATLDILAGFVLPAGSFDLAGRQLLINAMGKFGATVTGNVVISLYINPTMAGQTVTNGIISGGTVTGTGTGVVIATQSLAAGTALVANGGWQLYTNLVKYGAAGSNTQVAQGVFTDSVTSTPAAGSEGAIAPVFSTQAENAIMNIVLAASSSNSTAGEVVLNAFQVGAYN